MIAIAPLLAGLAAAPQMLLHLRADTGIVLDASSHVQTWKDLSPRHTDFVTPNFATPSAVFLTRYHDTAEKRIYKTFDSNAQLRPRVIAEGMNGHAAVAFDGSQTLVDTTSLPLDSGFTLFVVAQDSTGNGHSATLLDKGPGDFNTDLPNGWADTINGCFNMGLAWVRDFAQTDFETAAPTLYQSAWDGLTAKLWANGQFLASGTGSNPGSRNKSTWIGGVANPYDDLQNFTTGRIAEIRIYAGSLPDSVRKSIEDSLIARYDLKSIVVTPPPPPPPPPPVATNPLIAHLRADTGLVLDSRGLVATWKDLSPRHTDFVTTNFGMPKAVFVTRYHDTAEKRIYKTYEADSLLRPRVTQHGIGDRPSVIFDGQQALSDTTSLPLDSGFTLIAVAQDLTGNGYAATLVDKGPGDMNTAFSNGWADSINGCYALGIPWIDDVAISNFESSSPTLYGSSWDGHAGNLWANGQFLSTGTWSRSIKRNKATWIGGVKNPYGELQAFLNGRISEIRIYAGTLGDQRRKEIEDSLIDRYSLKTVPPPPPPVATNPLIAHLRADTGLVLDSRGRVSAWKDLSPRHTNFVTTNFGKPTAVFVTRYHDTAEKRVYKTYDADSLLRPRVIENGIGGKPSVVFDGEQALADTTSLPLDSGFTIFTVAQDSTGNGFTATLVDKGPGDFNNDLPNGWDDSINGCYNMGLAWVRDFAQSNFETSNPTLYQSSWNGDAANLWANGQLLATGSGSRPAVRNKSTWIGGVANPYGEMQNFMTGRISEIRIYAGALGAERRKAIEDSLISRYGLSTVAPPPPPVAAPTLIVHLRADTGLVLDSNGRVATWKDLSNRHTDFVTTNFGKPKAVFVTRYHDTAEKRIYKTYDADSVLRPRVVENGIGGHASIAFDGQQALVDTTSLPLDSGFTLFAVAQDSTGNGYAATLVDKGPNDMNTAFSNGWADSINGCFALGIPWVDNVTTSNFESNSPTLYGSSWDGKAGNLWANGQFLSTGTWSRPITRNKSTWIGGVKNPYGEMQAFLKGRISEIRIYAGTFGTAERKAIENSLMSRYGLAPTVAPRRTQVADRLHLSTRVVRMGSRYQILTSEFDRALLVSPNGRIIFNQSISGGEAMLPEFHGTAILRLIGPGKAALTRILATRD